MEPSNPVTFPEPTPARPTTLIPLADWAAPEWAVTADVSDGGIWYSLEPGGLFCLDDRDAVVPCGLQVTQYDALDVAAGQAPVVVRHEPLIVFEGVRLTLDQADRLGRALIAVAERAER